MARSRKGSTDTRRRPKECTRVEKWRKLIDEIDDCLKSVLCRAPETRKRVKVCKRTDILRRDPLRTEDWNYEKRLRKTLKPPIKDDTRLTEKKAIRSHETLTGRALRKTLLMIVESLRYIILWRRLQLKINRRKNNRVICESLSRTTDAEESSKRHETTKQSKQLDRTTTTDKCLNDWWTALININNHLFKNITITH